MAERPKIGMIGNGNVGSNLEKGLKKAGYPVQSTGNDPERIKKIAKDSDILVLAVPHDALRDVVGELDGADRGKVLVDVTNLTTKDGDFGGSLEQSGAERLQTWAKEAKVVKAFNTVFAKSMDDGRIANHQLSVLIAADDDRARKLVADMARDIGFDAVEAGPLENARWLETLGHLNIQLGYKVGLGEDIGFRLVHHETEAQRQRAEPQAR